MRFANGRNEAYDHVIPIPEWCEFAEEQLQMHLAIGNAELPRLRLIFYLRAGIAFLRHFLPPYRYIFF